MSDLPIRQKMLPNGEIVQDELMPDGTLIKWCVVIDIDEDVVKRIINMPNPDVAEKMWEALKSNEQQTGYEAESKG